MNTSRSQSSDGPTTRVQRPGQKRPGIRELGVINNLIVKVGAKVQGTHTLGVFATIGRAKRLFKAWLVYSATMMPFGYLSRQETELVILRVAFRKESAYEEAHHRAIGRRRGCMPRSSPPCLRRTTVSWDAAGRCWTSPTRSC
ncbi:MAG: carboxymuconolactone decarboxylase family protein [Corynebacterium sp.]|uniref:carboxymuconolactone decarboxylase family protein n=1 Tax=Corynebacterium sp. TaxID=1720 RepID=UPI0026486D80|nr:carboxymuconolactone decarboxylase family protein [Corynebacterium sp.]MDN5723268.1 carboxymuconolactone decarboxylase family protein [Corynebacterium sp.]